MGLPALYRNEKQKQRAVWESVGRMRRQGGIPEGVSAAPAGWPEAHLSSRSPHQIRGSANATTGMPTAAKLQPVRHLHCVFLHGTSGYGGTESIH